MCGSYALRWSVYTERDVTQMPILPTNSSGWRDKGGRVRYRRTTPKSGQDSIVDTFMPTRVVLFDGQSCLTRCQTKGEDTKNKQKFQYKEATQNKTNLSLSTDEPTAMCLFVSRFYETQGNADAKERAWAPNIAYHSPHKTRAPRQLKTRYLSLPPTPPRTSNFQGTATTVNIA